MPAAFVTDGTIGRAQWLSAFNVDDIDAAARRLRAAGGEALGGLRQLPGGAWLLPARDPQGATFGLVGSLGRLSRGRRRSRDLGGYAPAQESAD